MAALVSNLTQADAIAANGFTLGAFAGASAMPNQGIGINGIDDANFCGWLNSDGNITTANVHYGGYLQIATATNGYDISGVDQALIVHFRQQNLSFNTYTSASDSLWVSLASNGNIANYARWEMNIQNIIDGTWYQLIMTGTPDTTAGSWDNTDVTHFGIACDTNTTGSNFGLSMIIDQLLYIDGPVVFEDTGTAAEIGIQDFVDKLAPDSGETYHSLLVKTAGPTFEFACPIDFQVDDYADSTVGIGIAFRAPNSNNWPSLASGYYQLLFTPPASSDNDFSALSAINTATDYDLTIDASAASCAIDFSSTVFAGVNTAVIGGAGLTMTGCSLV